MSRKATLNFDGKEIELPIITGSEDENAIDISKIRSETGLITLDKGFKNTGSTTSNITYLDGEKGILRHRGYSIEELASKSTFTEVSYLLIYGELPTKNQLEEFENKLQQEQEALAYQYRLEREKSEAERKRIEANGEANANRIINSSLTPALLKMRGIEATTKLAESPNSKVIVIGSGKDGLPLILGGNN